MRVTPVAPARPFYSCVHHSITQMSVFLTHSPVKGLSHCFHCFTVTNNIRTNILLTLPGQLCKNFTRVGKQYRWVFYLIRHLPIVLESGYACLNTPSGDEYSVSHQHLAFLHFLIFTSQRNMKWDLIVLICISLIPSKAECIVMY